MTIARDLYDAIGVSNQDKGISFYTIFDGLFWYKKVI